MKSPAFQFYVRDWISSRSIQKMTGDEVKAYVYLLAESWLEVPRATLPNDDNDLALMAKLPIEKWMRVKPRVMANFNLRDNRWVNPRLAQVSDKQSKFSTWGKMGGNPNIMKNESKQVNPEVNPTLNPSVNLSSSSSSSSVNKEEESPSAPVATLPNNIEVSQINQDTVKAGDLALKADRRPSEAKRSISKLENLPIGRMWKLEFGSHEGCEYLWTRGDDKASSILATLKISQEELRLVMRAAFENKESWWCGRVKTLSLFAEKFNDIRGDWEKVKSKQTPTKPTGCFTEDGQ